MEIEIFTHSFSDNFFLFARVEYPTPFFRTPRARFPPHSNTQSTLQRHLSGFGLEIIKMISYLRMHEKCFKMKLYSNWINSRGRGRRGDHLRDAIISNVFSKWEATIPTARAAISNVFRRPNYSNRAIIPAGTINRGNTVYISTLKQTYHELFI